MKKRIISILLAILMVFAMIPLTTGKVYAESDTDTVPPVINPESLSVTLPEGKDKVTVGDTVTFAVDVTDDRYVRRVQIDLKYPVSNKLEAVVLTYSGEDEEGRNGTWTGDFTITDETECGIWQIRGIYAYDDQNGASVMNKNYMSSGTDLSAYDVEVYGTSADPDTEPPVINPESLCVALPEGKNIVTVGDTVTFAVDVTDDRYVSRVQIDLDYPVSQGLEALELTYVGTDEEGRNGTWTGEFTITDETECGIWKIRGIYAYDSQNGASVMNKNYMSSGTDLSACDFEVTAPDCPLDLTTSGYSMMLDGEGADATFGGNYYVDTADQTVTPTVKVRFDAEDGTWTTLAPRKYTLKFEKKTGDNTWEVYTGDTFGVDENGTATYRVSATGKESLHYTGMVGPVEFKVIKKNTVTFVSSYDNSVIETVQVKSGETVKAIKAPVIYDSEEGGNGEPFTFYGWGTDPKPEKYSVAEASLYDFSKPVNENVTLYAIYRTSISFVATEGGSVSSGVWGGSYGSEAENGLYLGAQNRTAYGYAKADEGYHFIAWRIGSAQGENAAEKGIACIDRTDWNGDDVNTIYVPSDHNYTLYAVFGHEVTFDSQGGSEIVPQYVIPGGKATRPDPSPVKEGFMFDGWYKNKELTQYYYFSDTVNEDITLYAKWNALLGINSYDATTETDMAGGKFSVTEDGFEQEPISGWIFMTMDPGAERVLKAYSDKGNKFLGWYKGKVENIYKDGQLYSQTIIPVDINDPSTLLSTKAEYPITIDQNMNICAVFEKCTDHEFGEELIRKATPDADGRIYHVCTICGVEETIAPIPRVSSISLEGTSFTYTGKAITPKVTVANTEENLTADCYDVTFSNNINVGTATAKVTLKGDYYEGSKTLTFKITAKKIAPTLTLSPTKYIYNGKAKTPGITVKNGSVTLKKDKDYTVTYPSGRKNAGNYMVTVKLMGNYSGTASKAFTINKAANPLKIKAKTAAVKLSTINAKKSQTLAVTKVITFTKKGQGKMTYKKTSGSKYITINKSTGKVTVKKGIAKGTYKVKVKVRAAGNANYKVSAWKSVTLKITVK